MEILEQFQFLADRVRFLRVGARTPAAANHCRVLRGLDFEHERAATAEAARSDLT